jgi:outer membrane protein assembly factor BamB
MRFMRAQLVFALSASVLLGLTGCKDQGLRSASGQLQLQPGELSFGPHYVGGLAEQTIAVVNVGRSDLTVVWDQPGAPFEISAQDSFPAGETQILIRFRPTRRGTFAGQLSARLSNGEEATLALSGEGQEIPVCPTPTVCHTAEFNVELGRCEERAVGDGTSCGEHSQCLLEPVCVSGTCRGIEKSCDDGNACTVDLCNAVTGCEHLPGPPCPGDGACKVGVCDPRTGCGVESATDGTFCGPQRGCDLADVCIEGACVQRDPPDGFVCAPASPCQEAGRCVASSCERSAPVSLMPSWSFDAASQGAVPLELHDFIVEPDGAVSLMGFFAVPKIRANTAVSKSASTPARRCLMWNGRLICADYPYVGTGKVSALDPANANTLWTFDLPTQRPDFSALSGPGHIFMARLAVLGSDRLAALFEAFPAGTSNGTLCRMYFLVILDASGGMVSAQRLTDPLLDGCNHPHPFGIVADADGNLYVGFSPSQPGQAPLVPERPTLLMSVTRDGTLRWKRLETGMVGGELAVARGTLYPQNSPFGLYTASGMPNPGATVSESFGRVVASSDRLIPSPRPGATLMVGFDRSTGAPRWSYSLRPGEMILSDQIRLSGWKSTPASPTESLALVFVQRDGRPTLNAVNARYGNEEWSCPLGHSYRTAPQLLEVANGSIALMEGSDECGNCDPPYAQSEAEFHSFPVRGLEVSREPWIGTFGGADHDCREER